MRLASSSMQCRDRGIAWEGVRFKGLSRRLRGARGQTKYGRGGYGACWARNWSGEGGEGVCFKRYQLMASTTCKILGLSNLGSNFMGLKPIPLWPTFGLAVGLQSTGIGAATTNNWRKFSPYQSIQF
ncbi:hypothetical protein Nepgr_015622 [Nepenthes gracilis]|uniref:Uncharacterized protein n=1 Tax=Nepenthes gracilis TaxID=150966 RepID=A0AAD3SNY2_NEPGR|nr:hypothetical protein Nepgr_015622 [Nepenthes gracilis]